MAKRLLSHDLLYDETAAADYLPYTRHITENIIGTNTGIYVSIWKIGGRSHDSVSQEDVIQWKEEQNNLLRGIATENVAFWSYVVRRKVNEYPDSEFEGYFATEYDKSYKEGFDDGTLKINELYLAAVYRPSVDKVMNIMSRFEKFSVEDKLKLQKSVISQLGDINRRIRESLGRRYNAELLGAYERNGFMFSAPQEFLGRLYNGEHTPMPITRQNIAEALPNGRVFFSLHGEIGELRSANKTKYFGMTEIVAYPDPTEPGHLNMLLKADFEFVLAQSFSPLSKPAARDWISKQIQLMQDSNDPAIEELAAMRVALGQLVSGEFVLGEHHATVTTFGDSVGEVRNNNASVIAQLADRSIKAGYVDKALEAGFWSQFPGVFQYRPRPSPITSRNFLGFSSFHNFMSGKPTGNPWGPALTILKTVTGSPLYFSYHFSRKDDDAFGKRPPGNTMIVGMTGTGKTVAVGHLLTQGEKFKPTVCAFDKDKGLSVLIRALGGKYFDLEIGKPTGWNPLQLPFTRKNLVFLKVWIKALLASDNLGFTHSDDVAINKALKALSGLPQHLKRLSALIQQIPDPEHDDPAARPTVASRLLKWCGAGDYAWIFDNEQDELDLSKNRLFGFDITEFIESPDIRSPMMMYLLYRTESMIKGEPFQYVFDEYWKPLEDPFFQYMIKNKQKTIRKQNGLNLFASQEPEDAINNPIHSTLISQIATFIFFPNPRAKKESYIDGFSLSEREFEIIKGFGEDSRLCLIKQGDNSAIGRLDLSHMGDQLLVLSGTPDNAEICDEVIKEVGDNPEVWLPVYVSRVKAAERGRKI